MAFDGITLHSIIDEMQILVGGKINHVHQPSSNNITINIYSGKNYLLNIDTSASNYRIHLTTHSKSNPIQAPNFCMVLRKYLISSRIKKIYMNGLERICFIDFECFNDMNDKITRTLAIELMGKYSNIILLNEDKKIIDALKKFDVKDPFLVSQVNTRCIMPARKYTVPNDTKTSIYDIEFDEFEEIINSSDFVSLESAISGLFTGLSKCFVQSAISYLHLSNNIGKKNLSDIFSYISNVILKPQNTICQNFKNNYSIFYDDKIEDSLFKTNFFIDDFYYQKDENEFYTAYRNNLLKVLSGTLDKLTNKLKNINDKIDSCAKMDTYKLYGELLISNIYRFNNVYEDYVELENYYSENNDKIKIQINPSCSISQNAEKYFKKYNKMKNTLRITSIQKEETKAELNYLESLINELDNCSSLDDIDKIYDKISKNILYSDIKFKKKNAKKSRQDDDSLNNYIRTSVDGFDVFIGKNNKQNDYLTTKVANSNDYWFHTKDIHGSHLILRSNGETPKLQTIKQCAKFAAHYSKAKFSSHVPVDYTLVKYVKKPHGAVPGYVIYTNNKTIFIDP